MPKYYYVLCTFVWISQISIQYVEEIPLFVQRGQQSIIHTLYIQWKNS